MENEVFKEGYEACFKNAELWLNEGSLLLKNGSYGHACALFIHGLEGLMHTWFTWLVYIGALKPDNKDLLDSFKSHKIKLETFGAMYIGSMLAKNQEAEDVLDLNEISSDDLEQGFRQFKRDLETLSRDLLNFRNRSIYVIYSYNDLTFKSPLDIPKEEVETLSTVIFDFNKKIEGLIREPDEKIHEMFRRFSQALY